MTDRRDFLKSVGSASLGLSARFAPDQEQELPPLERPAGTPAAVARDDAYWRRVSAYYRIPTDFTNLEAGNFGMMPIPVFDAYRRHTERVNLRTSFCARREYGPELDAVQAKVAAAIGADVSEIAFTRGATEALQCLIGGYNKLRPG